MDILLKFFKGVGGGGGVICISKFYLQICSLCWCYISLWNSAKTQVNVSQTFLIFFLSNKNKAGGGKGEVKGHLKLFWKLIRLGEAGLPLS